MSEKLTVPIRMVALGIYDGPHATPHEANEGPIFLGIKNVTPEGRLDLSETRHISEQDYPKWIKRITPQQDDIVFSYEATLHRYALIPEGFIGCLGRRMALVRPDKNKIIPRFLFYYFLSPAWKTIIESNVINGATVDRIPIHKFPDFEVSIPSIITQTHIASILSAYDDLIENNRRRIALLEQAARLLYREWFVQLRFPGHEHTPIIDGIPQGWEKKKYKDLFNFLNGYPFKSTTYQTHGRFGIVTIRNVHDAHFIPDCSSFLDFVPNNMKPHCFLSTGDILLSLTGNVGRACIVYGDGFLLNQRVVKIVGEASIPRSFVYWTFSNEASQLMLEKLAYGVAQLNLSSILLGEQDVLKPSSMLIEMFSDICEPIFKQLCILNIENRQLAQARDLLLPRLMNGELVP